MVELTVSRSFRGISIRCIRRQVSLNCSSNPIHDYTQNLSRVRHCSGHTNSNKKLTLPRKGRKPVLWLSLIGIVISSLWIAAVLALGQSISIYVILVSPVFAVIGGGSTVLVSAIYSVVADVVSETDRYDQNQNCPRELIDQVF